MTISELVTTTDLNHAADEVEVDLKILESLGYPVIHNRELPSLLRRVAVELEILKLECWRLSQGEHKS